jgi:hypothetical protein
MAKLLAGELLLIEFVGIDGERSNRQSFFVRAKARFYRYSEINMLKEQLFGFAINAITRVNETKEKIKKSLKSEIVQNYVLGLRQAAIQLIEQRLNRYKSASENLRKASVHKQTNYAKEKITRKYTIKKARKSSIRQAKEINSERAETILSMLQQEHKVHAKDNTELSAKRSLDCLIWALGQATRAELNNGISVHDVSALLYKAHNINLYPINISRVVHSNESLVKQSSQASRTKTYLLTDAGMRVFNEKFM